MKVVWAACGISLAIGLFFIFGWAPQPWGWEGFDHYHQLALAIADGQPFPTMEVPWGYAYFLAFFYRVFGDHPWIPLVVQAALNACMPLLVFLLAREWFDGRIAAVAALLTGICSFNTVYASTQSSDAVCTVLFTLAILAFVRATRQGTGVARGPNRWWWLVLAGALAGIAPQFRPNLILVPALLAGWTLWRGRSARALAQAGVLVACAGAMLAPWVVRNYELTGTILPTSVHGGVQLWYGTLQVGPYLNSRAYNPKSVFEASVFDYTSLERVPLIVSAEPKACAPARAASIVLTYWTDHDGTRRTIQPVERSPWSFEIPAPDRDAVVYFYFHTTLANGVRAETPAGGPAAPFVYFVSENHLGDQDVHGDLVDVFDLVRAARAKAWGERPPLGDRLAAAGIRADDPEQIARVMAVATLPPGQAAATRVERVSRASGELAIVLADGSSITVPKAWSGRITDLTFEGAGALALMHTHESVASFAAASAAPAAHDTACAGLEDVRVNDVFYRREPHMMRRYSALAWDNIRRAPLEFAAASAYRAVRLFVIYGTRDAHTAQQFTRSRLVYVAATVVSAAYLLLFAAGVWGALRHHRPLGLPLLLILYVPATIAPVLTNMRYTVTVQPLVFMFVAEAVMAAWRPGRRPAARPEAHGRAGSRTAPQP